MNVHDAPELAAYQDEPAQLPSAAPGKVGRLRLGFTRRDGRTILSDLYRQAPLVVQQALYWDEAMPELPCVYIITTSGGVLQGDRYDIQVDLGEGAWAHVTTQSATKIQEMDANYAAQTQQITLGENAYLEYLPEATIPYRHSRFLSRTLIRLPRSATVLYGEVVLPGRKHYGAGELFVYDLFSAAVSASRPDGTPLFVEKYVIEPARFPIDPCSVMGRHHVFANVLLLTSPERAASVLDELPPTRPDDRDGVMAGASQLPNDAGLIYKAVGSDTELVRARVRHFWELARKVAVGQPLMSPFAWR